ncbi:putative growth hormone-inducible soluble protein [Ixodes scapularis]
MLCKSSVDFSVRTAAWCTNDHPYISGRSCGDSSRSAKSPHRRLAVSDRNSAVLKRGLSSRGRADAAESRTTMTSLRGQVVQLYKNLLHLGRDYPKGYDYFRTRLKAAFMKNREVTDPEQLSVLLARGQYIIKELEALYMLKKYRTLKKRYYSDR